MGNEEKELRDPPGNISQPAKHSRRGGAEKIFGFIAIAGSPSPAIMCRCVNLATNIA